MPTKKYSPQVTRGLFQLTDAGFQITFPNYYTVSVMFGPGNYCSNRGARLEDRRRVVQAGSATAEVAIWKRAGAILVNTEENHQLRGYQTPDEVIKILSRVARRPRYNALRNIKTKKGE